MSNQTALMEKPAPSVTTDQLALVKTTVAKDASDAELKLYLYDCARQGVHPLDRLLHFTKRGGKYTPVTSIDLMRIRAAETGEYAGSDDATFAGEWSSDGSPDRFTATVTVYRLVQGTRCPFTATARWREYFPGEQSGHMWKKMPHTMLAKCAEALALRKGFPRQLAGLYASEELDQADRHAPEPARLQVQASVASPTAQAETSRPEGAARRDVAPSVPNGEGSGHSDIIDTESGEVLPDLPPGVYYLTGYSISREWHEATVLKWDSQGGALKISTKRPAVGQIMAKASNEHLPIHELSIKSKASPGEAYVNSLSIWGREIDVADDEPPPLSDEDLKDLPF